MRTWFWTLLLAVVAVALAVVLRAHAGNVLLLVWPWRIELSLTLTVLLLVAAFVTLYVGLRLLAWLVAIPDRLRAWRGRRAQERDHELLERGWIGLLEGRFAQAEKDLSKLFDQTKVRSSRVLAALSGARAAHNLGEYERRDRMLESAREQAGEDAGLQEATATVSADMLLDQGAPSRRWTCWSRCRTAARAICTPCACCCAPRRPCSITSACSCWRAACCGAMPSARPRPSS